MKLSKSTWTLFVLAALFYSFAWTKIAGALAIFGLLFELGMYISMFADFQNKEKKGNESENGAE